MKLKKKLVVTLLSVRTSVCQAPFLEIIREKHHHHRYIFDVGHPYYNIKSLPIFFRQQAFKSKWSGLYTWGKQKCHYFEFQSVSHRDVRTLDLASSDWTLMKSNKNDSLRLPRVSISHNTTPNDHLKRKRNHYSFFHNDVFQRVMTSLIYKFSF